MDVSITIIGNAKQTYTNITTRLDMGEVSMNYQSISNELNNHRCQFCMIGFDLLYKDFDIRIGI